MNAHDIAKYAMGLLKDTGAQQYSAQAHTSKKHEFNVDGGQFSLLRTTIDNRLDLTLIKDSKRGKELINEFSQPAVLAAVKDCLASSQSAQADDAWEMTPGPVKEFLDGAIKGDMDKLFLRTQELLQNIQEDYPNVMVEQMIVAHQQAEGLYLNSLGADYTSREGAYSISLMFSGHDGDKTSSFNGAGLTTKSLDIPFIELANLRRLLSDAQRQVHTVPAQGKFEGAVVFTPECAGEMLAELLGTYVTDSVMLDGTSQWKDKLGETVVDERLSVSSSPLHPDIVCGERYMADGMLSDNFDIIKDGKLTSFMLSSYAANKLKLDRCANTGFNLVVDEGVETAKEIIKGIDRGLLVSRFSGGSPASNGDFSGVAKNSFLIRDGQVAQAVSETMISGNLGRMFKKLRGISTERLEDGSSLLPYIAVDGITISGK